MASPSRSPKGVGGHGAAFQGEHLTDFGRLVVAVEHDLHGDLHATLLCFSVSPAGAPWSSAGRPSRGHRLGDQDCPLLPRHLHRLASLAICAKPTFDAVAARNRRARPRPTTLTSTTCQSHTG